MGAVWRRSSGCDGPHPDAAFDLEMPDGSKERIDECPYRILNRANPETYRAIRWFFAFSETGVLPCSGGYFEQAAGFDECVAALSFARATAMRARERKADDDGKP